VLPDVSQRLATLMGHALPEALDLEVRQLRRISNGLSRENWAFDISYRTADGAQQVPLIALCDAEGGLLNTDRFEEFAVLKALEQTSVPAPAGVYLDLDGQWMGSPTIVLERMPGESDFLVLNGDKPLEVRVGLGHQFIDIIASLQQVDWRALGLADVLQVPTTAPASVELDLWEAELRRVQLEPLSEMEYVLAWLRRSVPDPEAIVLVHGDFKPGNALVLGDRVEAVLDWETVHLGDPLEDLGWVTNPVRRHEHQILGAWERAQIIDRFRARSGLRATEHDVVWWNVFSCWKLAVIGLTGTHEFVLGRYDRVFQTPTWLFRPMFRMIQELA
jgi:aminoglycoside phosphotransferase (APT) family kinase protein